MAVDEHFNFGELMDAVEAFGILSGCTGFTTEAVGEACKEYGGRCPG